MFSCAFGATNTGFSSWFFFFQSPRIWLGKPTIPPGMNSTARMKRTPSMISQ